MKRINSYDELNRLIMQHFKKGVCTNCFTTKDEFDFFINKKRLFYTLYDGGLLIFIKMHGYFNMKFYITNFDSDLRFAWNKKIVVEVAGKSEKDLGNVVEYLKKNGLNLTLKRIRFSCTETIIDNDLEIKNVEKSKIKDYSKIIKILRKNYDKYTGCIPVEEKIKTDIINGNFYCYREGKKILGILHVNRRGKISEMRHLVVLTECRGKHISKYLVTKYLADIDGMPKQVWTSVNNEVAKRLFRSFGYKTDGYISYVLMN